MGLVRVATEDDAAVVREIYAPYVLETAISFEEAPPSQGEMRRRIGATLATHPFLAYEEDGAVVGYAYASPHHERAAYRWSVDVAIYAAREVQRRGVGRALYARLLEILEQQGFHAAFAGITLPNANSVGLHEAMGFRHFGTCQEVGFKLGSWRDVGWWRRPIGEGPPARDPIPFAALAGGLAG